MPKLKEECGIAGIISKKNKNIIKKTILTLLKLQHRGQDAAGICFLKNGFKVIKGAGLIDEVLGGISEESNFAIAHTRYVTFGDNSPKNAQPVVYCDAALCHNGTIYEIEKFRKKLIDNGFSFTGNSDSEVILKWLFYKTSKPSNEWDLEEIREILNKDFKNGAFSVLILLKNRMLAFKDPNSFRPLVFAQSEDEFIIASEDCAISKEVIKKFEIKAGQGIEINKNSYRLTKFSEKNTKQCVFEAVYFANPKSAVFDVDVKKTRIKLGEILASDDEIEADYVVPVMNSGFWGARGYADKKNIEFKILIKTRNGILRTFIENEKNRSGKIEKKYILKKDKIKDRKIVLVDDSIVRGATSKKIIELLKSAKAKEIHLRLTSPMIINNCFWGVDIPDKNELLAYKLKTADNIKKELGINSVKFIDNSVFEDIFNKNIWCHNCFLNKCTTINQQE